ncbi:MAG TPA: glycosyltransferase family 4 protein [Acidimicrobiales bacterium]|nr:glycosyltransferase family 4 protein [Acidimicrobiales bacterium]
MVRHILLTNDFPPKVGGIQSYLWELWRRLPPDEVVVFTSAYPGAQAWDSRQKFRVVRAHEPVLLPQPHLARRVRELAASTGAEAVVIDPALPLGLVGPHLGLPYAVVLHGAEVTVPGRLPASRQLLARSLRGASLLVAAGKYPEMEARRAIRAGRDRAGDKAGDKAGTGAGTEAGAGDALEGPPAVLIPPGVDTERFHPLPHIDRAAARARLGLPRTGHLVVSVSRLVPRKGMDTLIEAATSISARFGHGGLSVAIAGAGRDRGRLERLERVAGQAGVTVKLTGRLADADLPDFYACADVFALCCRSRWWGLEQEGFGIVLLEAAACGIPCITVDSGGAGEAVVNGETGLVVTPEDDPSPKTNQRRALVRPVAEALSTLLSDAGVARRMGEAGQRRAEEEFSYDILAPRLAAALDRLPLSTGR